MRWHSSLENMSIPPLINVNNMRKFLHASFGVLIGTAISIAMIMLNVNKVAFSEEDAGWWNNMVANVDTFDWDDALPDSLSSESPSNFYNLVYGKLNVQAENDALKAVAGQYGLTTDEARAVVDGSIAPILNNPDLKGAKLTNEDAAIIMEGLQADFQFLNELYQIQKEVEVAVKPSELFANNDLEDSGFDLVYDLTVIEEILFLDTTEPSVGNPFSDQADQPYDPTLLDASTNEYLVSPTPVAAVSVALTATGESAGLGEGEGGAVLNIGDEKVDVEILESDVCPADESLLNALDNFEEDQAAEGDEGDEGAGAAGESDAGEGTGDEDSGDDDGDDSGDYGEVGFEGTGIEPAPADTWIKEWCQGLSGGDSASANAEASLELKSLGGITNPLLSAGAQAGFENNAISAQVAICLETIFIKEAVSSYQPGDSCVLCEVEKINEHLEETLSHSLVPGKATGNLFESAKCKETKAAGFDMQIVTIPNPIPLPPHDDLIYGKNVFEEWNKFVDRYKPIGLGKFPPPDVEAQEPEASEDFQSKQAQKHAPSYATQSEILARIRKNKAQKIAEALTEVENYHNSQDSTNVLEYSRNVIGQMKVMNEFFESFRATLQKINEEPIAEIEKKSDK